MLWGRIRNPVSVSIGLRCEGSQSCKRTRTKSETPSVEVTVETSKSSFTTPMLTLNMELANVTVKTNEPIDNVIAHLRFVVQFLGFPGSSGPSKSMNSGFWFESDGGASSGPFSISPRASFDAERSSALFSCCFGCAWSMEDRGDGVLGSIRSAGGPWLAVSVAIVM
jgi:hypothetical protein